MHDFWSQQNNGYTLANLKSVFNKNPILVGKTHDSCEDICQMGFDNADDSANDDLGLETTECIAVGIGAIYVKDAKLNGRFARPRNSGGCLGTHLRQYSRRINRANSACERCLERCELEKPSDPELVRINE